MQKIREMALAPPRWPYKASSLVRVMHGDGKGPVARDRKTKMKQHVNEEALSFAVPTAAGSLQGWPSCLHY